MERGVTGRRLLRRSKNKNYRVVDTIYIHGGNDAISAPTSVLTASVTC